MKRMFSIVALALFFLIPPQVFAQSTFTGTLGDVSSLGKGGLSMSVSPQYPAPGTNVNITLQDYQDDLNIATIVWSVNGKQVTSGVGQASYQLTTGANGTRQTVSATVTTQSGSVLTASTTILPAGVDILWQAHSYVPPFYRGKALFPFQGTVSITAMPSFALTNPKNAIYSWQLGGVADPDVSGSGKNTITLTGSILLQPLTVSVTVESSDQSLTAQNNITLTGTNPGIVFYQESPLYGFLLNEALGSSLSLTGQAGINAAPYYFDSTAPYTNSATFQWSMNGQALSNQSGQVLVVAPPSGQSGTSTVSASASNSAKSFQSASSNINVGFND